jgi:hypothetical protein
VAKTYEVGGAEKVDVFFEKLVARQLFELLKIELWLGSRSRGRRNNFFFLTLKFYFKKQKQYNSIKIIKQYTLGPISRRVLLV